jgi:hypothetical protein
MKIVLISPQNSDARIALGDDLPDALETFHSIYFDQGFGTGEDRRNQIILEDFGDYQVYAEQPDGDLRWQGCYAVLLGVHCPQHLPRGMKHD